jgi:NADH:ubiquinone oxidoreductase subunit F (NADH-binding)
MGPLFLFPVVPFCPLGQNAGVSVMSTLKNFRPEIEAHIREKKCNAGGCRSI